jgi:hypothetical protein
MGAYEMHCAIQLLKTQDRMCQAIATQRCPSLNDSFLPIGSKFISLQSLISSFPVKPHCRHVFFAMGQITMRSTRFIPTIKDSVSVHTSTRK